MLSHWQVDRGRAPPHVPIRHRTNLPATFRPGGCYFPALRPPRPFPLPPCLPPMCRPSSCAASRGWLVPSSLSRVSTSVSRKSRTDSDQPPPPRLPYPFPPDPASPHT